MSQPLLPFQFKFENAGLMLKRPTDLVPRGQYVILKNFYTTREGALRPRFGTVKVNSAALAQTNIHSLGYLNDPVAVVASGLVTVSNFGVVWETGDLFVPGRAWVGKTINIVGGPQPIASVPTTTALTLTTSVGGTYADAPYQVLGASLLLAGAFRYLYRLDTSAEIDNGYSGNPLSMVPYRMNNSSSPYMIVGDSAQMRLIASGGVAAKLGLSAPSLPVSSFVLPASASETLIDNFDVDSYTYGGAISSHTVAASFPNGVVAIDTDALQVVVGTNDITSAWFKLADTVNLNLLGSLPATDSDLITFWFNCDNLANLDILELYFYLGSTTTDYFFYPVLASNISVGSATSWFQVQIPRGSFTRYGANNLLDWSSVTSYDVFIGALGVPLTCTFDDMYLQRIQGPNSSVGVGYDWRVTDYDSTTGSEGNPSPLQANAPPSGEGTLVTESPVILIPPASTNARCNYRRFYRRGGSLGSTWQQLGSIQNIPAAAITTIVVNGTGLATITTSAAHNFPNGASVYIGTGNGIVSGCILSGISGLYTPSITAGQLYAQGTLVTITAQYLSAAPFNPAGGTVNSYVFCNSGTGIYYSSSSIPTTAGDAYIGEVQTFNSGGGGLGHGGVFGVTILDQALSGLFGYFQSITVTAPTIFTVPYVGSAHTYSGGTATLGFLDIYNDQQIASAATLSLTNDVPVTTVNSSGVTVYEQPLQRIWGPYMGTVIFGCQDPNRPGYLYWCNAGNPDGWSSINNVEVTQPSDPLQNGFYWGGLCWVFSKENLFPIYPAQLGIPNQYQPVPSPCGRGLAYSDMAFAAGPDTPAIWGLGKDCIFETSGGPSVSITDDDLWPIFHGLASGPYMPIDFTQTNMLRMAYRDEELMFQYQDTQGNIQVLAYHHTRRRWRQATYAFGPLCLYSQPEGIPATLPGNEVAGVGNILLLGGRDGFCYQESPAAGGDAGTAIACQVRSGSYDMGLALRAKEFVHFILDADPQAAAVSVSLLYNDQAVSSGPQCGPFVASGTGRQPFPFGLNDYYGLNVMVDIQVTTVAAPVLYGFEVNYRVDRLSMVHTEVPEDSLGIDGFKHVYDGYITVRSNGIVNVILLADGVQIGSTIAVPSTAGQKVKTLLQFPANKFKLLRRILSGTTPFQVYAEDSVLHAGGWSDGQYRNVKLVENVE